MATAYELMGQTGVDGTSFAEIAEHTDLGFGTFYNYFKTKDDIAINVLDAVIEDLGRRNDLATERLKGRVPAEHAQEVAQLPVPELPPAQLNFMVLRDAKFGRTPTARNAR